MKETTKMNKQQVKSFSLIVVTMLILSLLIMPLRGGFVSVGSITGFKLSSIVGFIVYFIIFFLKRYKQKLPAKNIILAILIGFSILNLTPLIILHASSKAARLEFPIQLFGIISGCFFYYIQNRYLKIAFTICSIILCFLLSTKGYDLWLHKLNHATFTGKVSSEKPIKLAVQLPNGDSFSLDSLNQKYIVIDCWYTYCGVCYQKMPNVQKLHEKYINHPDISVYTLHARMEDEGETCSTGAKILAKEGYSIPSLSINMKDPILKDLGVKVYPTVLIFEQSGNLIFRGDIETAATYLDKL